MLDTPYSASEPTGQPDIVDRKIEAAKLLRTMGAHFVLLCESTDAVVAKRPKQSKWQKQKPTWPAVEAAIRGGWNVGIKPGSIQCLVVDVDTPSGMTDAEAIETVSNCTKTLSDWQKPVAMHPSSNERGAHVWYRKSAAKVGNMKWSVDGVDGKESGDIRADHGYLILWHIIETATQLQSNFYDADILSIAEFKSRFGMKRSAGKPTGKKQKVNLATKHTVGKSFTADCKHLANLPKGNRNNTLFYTCRWWWERGGMKDKRRAQSLRTAGIDSGMDATMVDATMASAMKLNNSEEEAEAEAQIADSTLDAMTKAAIGHRDAAKLFEFKHSKKYRYNNTRNLWMEFGKGVWSIDEIGNADSDGQDIIDHMVQCLEDPTAKNVAALHASGFHTGTMSQAAKLRSLKLLETHLDKHKHIASLPDGNAINLDTLETITDTDAIRDLYLTDKSQLGVIPKPSVNCELTRRFIFEGLLGEYEQMDRVEIFDWLLAFMVSAIRKEGSVERFLFIQGAAGTGKSTFVNLLSHIAGKTQTTIAAKNIINRNTPPSEWIAGLSGYRLAVINELPARGNFESSDLIPLVSNEEMSVRFLYGNSFNFTPNISLVIAGNSRPRIDSESGLFRRMVLVEANTVPKKVDIHLLAKLKAEAAGFLHMALQRHATSWKERLLEIPQCLAEGVTAYKSDTNPFDAWLADECNVDKGNDTLSAWQTADLYESFTNWCIELGFKDKFIMAGNQFSKQLNIRLGPKSKGKRQRHDGRQDYKRTGIALKHNRTILETNSF